MSSMLVFWSICASSLSLPSKGKESSPWLLKAETCRSKISLLSPRLELDRVVVWEIIEPLDGWESRLGLDAGGAKGGLPLPPASRFRGDTGGVPRTKPSARATCSPGGVPRELRTSLGDWRPPLARNVSSTLAILASCSLTSARSCCSLSSCSPSEPQAGLVDAVWFELEGTADAEGCTALVGSSETVTTEAWSAGCLGARGCPLAEAAKTPSVSITASESASF